MLKFSVIIPALNEAQTISQAISSIRSIDSSTEIIVVDGGSTDNTVSIAEQMNVRVLSFQRGRGAQCNAGARISSGDILLFLHADTKLPHEAFEILEKFFRDPKIQIGTFRLRFDHAHWLLRFYASLTSIDSLFTRFGDQCIVVRKSFFETLGGFPDWRLFEDVQFLRVARHRTRIVSFPAKVITSSRRFVRFGMLQTQWMNVRLFVRYLLNTPPEKLAQIYYGK